MANKITISNTDNKVTITSQVNNSINTTTNSTLVTVTQGSSRVITVNTPGPKGDPGASGGLIGPDILIRNISASGDISASGNIIAETLFSDNVGGNLIKKQATPTSNTFASWVDSSIVKSYSDFQANDSNISYKPQGYGPQYSLFEANSQNRFVQLGTIDTGLTEFKVDDSNVNMTMKFTADEITHTFDKKGIEVQGSITASGIISASQGLVIPSLDIGGLTSLGHDHKVVIASNDRGRLSILDGFTFNITDSRLVSPSASFSFINGTSASISDIFATNINPDGTTLNIGSTSNPGILHIQGDTEAGAGAGSPHLKLEGDWHPVAELDITLSQYGAEYDSHLHEFKSDGTASVSITGTGGVQVNNALSIEAGSNRIVNLGGGQLGDGFRLRTGENLQTFNHTSFVYDWLEWTGTGADQGYKFHTYTHKNLITLDGDTANVEIGNSDTGSVNFLNGSITASGDISASGTGSFERIKLNYDTMPTSDPNIKGVVYRSSSLGLNNLLFISAG
jgi:hypothetical protein